MQKSYFWSRKIENFRFSVFVPDSILDGSEQSVVSRNDAEATQSDLIMSGTRAVVGCVGPSQT